MMMKDGMTIAEIAELYSMSARTIRKHLDEIPHLRLSARGKVWIKRADFEAWFDRKKREIGADPVVIEILRDLAESA